MAKFLTEYDPPVVDVPAADAEMNAAIAHARDTLLTFWASYDAPKPTESGHCLKVRFAGDGYVEHIWNEDGQSGNPQGEVFNVNSNFTPGFWVHLPGGDGSGNTGSLSFNWASVPKYPWSFATLFQSRPTPKQCDPRLLQSFSSGGIQVGLGDGSVRLINSGVSAETWGKAIDPQDGLPLGNDW